MNKATTDGETQARSTETFGDGSIRLTEHFKNVIQLFLRNTDAAVGHGKSQQKKILFTLPKEPNGGDNFPLIRELERVAKQVS